VTELIVEAQPDSNAVYLSKREYETASLVAKGMQNKEIGRVLGIADSTLKVVLKNIYRKLRINRRTTLALIFVQSKREQQKQAAQAADELPSPQGAAAA
jgi:two-component system, NarL family, nitrate/nitrite response regulator NarL